MPLSRYYTLNIEPMKKVLREEGQVESHGLKHALSVCRDTLRTTPREKACLANITVSSGFPNTCAAQQARESSRKIML